MSRKWLLINWFPSGLLLLSTFPIFIKWLLPPRLVFSLFFQPRLWPLTISLWHLIFSLIFHIFNQIFISSLSILILKLIHRNRWHLRYRRHHLRQHLRNWWHILDQRSGSIGIPILTLMTFFVWLHFHSFVINNVYYFLTKYI